MYRIAKAQTGAQAPCPLSESNQVIPSTWWNRTGRLRKRCFTVENGKTYWQDYTSRKTVTAVPEICNTAIRSHMRPQIFSHGQGTEVTKLCLISSGDMLNRAGGTSMFEAPASQASVARAPVTTAATRLAADVQHSTWNATAATILEIFL